jgi:uncharacterized protein YjbJ (UPF0337 family)
LSRDGLAANGAIQVLFFAASDVIEPQSTEFRTSCLELFTARRRLCPAAVYATYNSQLVEMTMDWNRVEGNWKQTKGKIKEKWGQLTDDDLQQVNGKRDQLEGKIQERYGIAKDRARQDIDDWLKTMDRHSAM